MACLITGTRTVRRCGVAAVGVIATIFVTTLAAAEPGNEPVNEPRKTFVAALLQDEPRVLPEENAAFFTKSDRRVRFQLMRMDDSQASLLAGTELTVIDSDGRSSKLTADSRGLATLNDATAGVHAIVAAGPAGHVAVPLVLRERADDQTAAASTVRLPLINVEPGEVMRVANSFLPPADTLASAGSAANYDDQLISTGEIVAAHSYRVRTGVGGRLEGRVYSLMGPGTVGAALGGMNIMIYRGNALVARAISDAQGRFAVENILPGPYGLIAAGPAGYAAFSFEVIDSGELVTDPQQQTLVSTPSGHAHLAGMNQPPGFVGDVLPVLVVPPPMVPAVLTTIREYAPIPLNVGVEPVPPGFAPLAGGGFAGGGLMGGPGGGVGGGAGGGGLGGLGGIGGLLGLAGLGAGIAAVASDDDDDPIVIPAVATLGIPGFPVP